MRNALVIARDNNLALFGLLGSVAVTCGSSAVYYHHRQPILRATLTRFFLFLVTWPTNISVHAPPLPAMAIAIIALLLVVVVCIVRNACWSGIWSITHLGLLLIAKMSQKVWAAAIICMFRVIPEDEIIVCSLSLEWSVTKRWPILHLAKSCLAATLLSFPLYNFPLRLLRHVLFLSCFLLRLD